MLKLMFALLALASVTLAQSSTDGSFSVHHLNRANFQLNPSQMREAESLYKSACATVQQDFHNAGELHPRFIVIIGADHNEVYANLNHRSAVEGSAEIRMKKWNPTVFAQGVVFLAFDQILTTDLIAQLGTRALRYSNATVDVNGLK
jgi:hypothetical protein